MTWRRRKATSGEAEAQNREAATNQFREKTPFLPNEFKEDGAVAGGGTRAKPSCGFQPAEPRPLSLLRL
jgi:hypothetical protein